MTMRESTTSSPARSVAAMLACVISATAFCDDWPNWSGPGFNGISKETGFASTWTKDGLAPEWTREIGTGFSSMSVVGDRLFAMGHSDETETVWCLNPADGEVLWKHTYAGQLLPNLHEGGPGATPTIDESRVQRRV